MLKTDKDIFLLFKVMGGAVIAIVVFWLIYDNVNDKEYPCINNEAALYGKVTKTKPYQSVAYVELEDGLKFRLISSRNYKYYPYSLNEFIQPGDSLLKRANSDTLVIDRGNRNFVFVLGKDINKSLRK